jgi:formylglycine-generating enzyme required for sulfatase activity
MSYPHIKNNSAVYLTLGIFAVLCGFSCERESTETLANEDPDGMVWIPGGEFTMGSDAPDAFQVEKPAHRVRVDGFWMDKTEVTNAQFAEFVDATGYATTAEIAPTLEEIMSQVPQGTPPPPPEMLVPGALVFTPPDHAVPTDNYRRWWAWVPKADWRHPEGPGSSIEGREDHPVVHVSWDDAVAYAQWAGKRLPTEAEWEFAARGGLDSKPYVWGDERPTDEIIHANIWQGRFPDTNTHQDGFERTAPVASFERNSFGLYDVSGNVWEWCNDWFRPDMHARAKLEGGVSDNPQGPAKSFDPSEPDSPKRVLKGGSFLCSDSYCSAYRPSGRRGQSIDTGMSHIGFRCVISGE